MKSISALLYKSIVLGVVGSFMILSFSHAQNNQDCDPPGYFPTDYGLKDHSIFIYEGEYYLVSIYLPGEKKFAYVRSPDLCHWEELSPILSDRSSEWDSLAIWAPFVMEVDGVYYLYYAGVKGPYPKLTQSIMLATSTNPADPNSWQQQGMIFQPDHPGMKWQDGNWADCRDPMVLKVEETYYLYYTGRDVDGGIVGIATADTPSGPWFDWGSTLTLTGEVQSIDSAITTEKYWSLNRSDVLNLDAAKVRIPESATVYIHNGLYYLFYNSDGAHYRIGASPGGPWSDEVSFVPGWAHEVWTGVDGGTYTSYLSDTYDELRYTVTISPIVWDDYFQFPRPFVGEKIHHVFTPLLFQSSPE